MDDINLNTETTDQTELDNLDENLGDQDDEEVVLTRSELEALRQKAEQSEKNANKFKKLFDNARKHTQEKEPAKHTQGVDLQAVAVIQSMQLSTEEVAKAEEIASLRGITFKEAAETDDFQGYRLLEERRRKESASQLDASRRGKPREEAKTFSNVHDSKSHRELWEKTLRG